MSKTTNEVAVIQKEVNPIVEKAKALVIKNPKDLAQSAEFLSRLNIKRDELKKSKELLTKPLNTALKEIRSRYSQAEDMMDEAIESLRNEQSRYATEQKKLQETVAARVGEGKGKYTEDTGARKIDELEQNIKKVTTDSGKVSFREDQVLKVTNLEFVPKEYFDLNESRLLKALKAGMMIPGAELELKMTPVNSR